jgi:UDP-N-acetylglucosamine--N-acetylmuramyl-(pentapeptide) pyrophosphoryl-undecaprenol N-acetylglucosamine transferase
MFTGGHLTPAIAVIDGLRSLYPTCDIVFVGRTTINEQTGAETEESRIITRKKILFIPISAGKFPGTINFNIIPQIVRIFSGILQAIKICRVQKPSLIMSFGGYVAFPICAAAYLLKIPVITHEQTSSPGIANRLIGFIARKVCISYPSTIKYFPKAKTVLTGLPIRKSIFHPPENPAFAQYPKRPIIYILGGSSGSQSINNLVYPILSKLVRKYWVIHQTGKLWIAEAKRIRLNLRGDCRKYYQPEGYLDESDHSWLIHHANLVVSRSGANTVRELEIAGVQSLLIPLPWSRNNEQYLNAVYLRDKGNGKVFLQSDLNSDILFREIVGSIALKREAISHFSSEDLAVNEVIRQIKQVLKNQILV